MEILWDSFRTEWLNIVNVVPRLIVAAVIFLFFLAGSRVAGAVAGAALKRTRLTATHRNFFRRLAIWAIILVGLAAALNVVGLTGVATGLVASGGLTAIVIGFAFREIGENLLAGFFLAFSRPFRHGDWIQSGDFEGAVRSIDLRSTHIRTANGRDIFIPNAMIFNTPLTNFTLDGLRRPSFRVGIDYADDAAEAARLLRTAVLEVTGVLAEPGPTAFIAALQPAFVEIEVAFWVDVFQPDTKLPAVQSAVLDRCRRALREADFTLSNDVTTALTVASTGRPVDVRLAGDAA